MAQETEGQKPQITVKEFRMWLEGVIEMQDDNWIPDARQWNKILGKIYDIADNTAISVNTYVPQQYNHNPAPFIPAPMPRGDNDYMMAQPGLGGVPVTASYGSSLLAGDQGNIPVKTPSVDSTNGYDTPFV